MTTISVSGNWIPKEFDDGSGSGAAADDQRSFSHRFFCPWRRDRLFEVTAAVASATATK
jgi:hypothetical protein